MHNRTKKVALAAAVSAAILSLSATGALAHLEPKKGDNKEKCYGVVKAGKNDCASKPNKHSCSGRAKVDGDPNEWIKLPTGLCNKLVSGSLEQSEKGSVDDTPKE